MSWGSGRRASLIGRILVFYREGVEAGSFRRMSARHFFQNAVGVVLFHYAGRNFSAAVLGVEDIFTASAVHWRRDEVHDFVSHGVLTSPPPGSGRDDDPEL